LTAFVVNSCIAIPSASATRGCSSTSGPVSTTLDRGRDAGYPAPPAQIRTCPIKASGSYLGCLAANRTLGHG
jgi:hypothetical protein